MTHGKKYVRHLSPVNTLKYKFIIKAKDHKTVFILIMSDGLWSNLFYSIPLLSYPIRKEILVPTQ